MIELSEEDRMDRRRARKIQRFLSQPFHVAEAFTGTPGVYVELKTRSAASKKVRRRQKHDEYFLSRLQMVGTIGRRSEKAKKMAAS